MLGGCLLTGGFGSIVGAALGCLILGMTQQGIPLAGWDNNLYFLFLGVILLVAAFANEAIRRWATSVSRPPSEKIEEAAVEAERDAEATAAMVEADMRAGEIAMTVEANLVEPAGRDVDGHALIELQGLSKFFGNVIALQNITTSVRAGEVTCVLGDNGAGKSTFIKILAGVHGSRRGPLLDGGFRRSSSIRHATPRQPASPPSTRTWRWRR